MEIRENLRKQLAFFGITPETAPQIRAALFTQIHEIVFHGKGGYDWNTVYDMPIWLRKFVFSRIQSFYKEESDAMSRSTTDKSKKTLVDPFNIFKKFFCFC